MYLKYSRVDVYNEIIEICITILLNS